MDTSKYDEQTRRDKKLDQRSPAYRELQRRTFEERTRLEAKLHERAVERARLEAKLRHRDGVITRLKSKLIEIGCAAADIERLAA